MNATFSRRRRSLLQAGLATCGIAAVAGMTGTRAGLPAVGQYRFRGEIMGTEYNVSFVAPLNDAALRTAARAAVESALVSVDARMSTFKATSELARLNAHRPDVPCTLSEDTFGVIRAAEQVSAACAGAFDVTAGPLVNAWGFGPTREPRVPDAKELARLRRRVGYRLLELDHGERTVTKLHPEMYVDLSSIAKGYGVDVAARALDDLGVAHYVIEVGGEVRTRGRNVHGAAWQVAVEEPRPAPRTARIVVPLDGLAMATSGDYRIYFDRGGHRYSHEIDPVSASPVSHSLTSVTVVAPDCAVADACATALMVLGPDRGYALAERMGLGAYFITREADGRLRDRATPHFPAPRPARAA